MKIGSKVTVIFRVNQGFIKGQHYPKPSRPFLRCRVIQVLPDALQLYDPVEDWSWSCPRDFKGRVIFE